MEEQIMHGSNGRGVYAGEKWKERVTLQKMDSTEYMIETTAR